MDQPPSNQDVIEEEALNEKSCIQVLEKLIAKADEDILELETNVLKLQLQAALADKKWYELCFRSLKDKIEDLSFKTTCLKDPLLQDLYAEPAKTMGDIMRDLLIKFCLQKAQPARAPGTSPSLSAAAGVAGASVGDDWIQGLKKLIAKADEVSFQAAIKRLKEQSKSRNLRSGVSGSGSRRDFFRTLSSIVKKQ